MMNYEKLTKQELIKKLKALDSQQKEETRKIQIRKIGTGEVIYESKTETIKEALEQAVKEYANLEYANLKGAYLKGAYLEDAYLKDVYLEGANLEGANLEGAFLKNANLEYANLKNANLEDAYLGNANLLYCKMDKKVFKQITEDWFEWDIEDKENGIKKEEK